MRTLTVGLLALVLAGCGGPEADEPEPAPPAATPAGSEVPEAAAPTAPRPAAPMHPDAVRAKPAAVSVDSPVGRLRAQVAAIASRKEHDAPAVVVQQILVAVEGGGIKGVTRTPEQAEVVAAELLDEIQSGKPLAFVRRGHTDDPGLGIYTLTPASRDRYVKGFGDVAWRLAVGEVGVVPYDNRTSPGGFHILQRTQ